MKRGRFKSLIVFPFLAAFLSLASCSKTDIEVHERFIDYFKITDAQLKELKNEVQDINQEAASDGFTVNVIQTLGDEQTLHIAVNVTYPEDVAISSDVEEDIILWPKTIELVDGLIHSSDEIKYQKHRRPYHSYSPSIDFESKTVYYIFTFDVDGYNDDSVSFLISGFELRVPVQEQSEEFRTEEMIFTWTPTNKGKVIRAKVIDANQMEVGDISLSRYRMKLDLRVSEFTSFSAVIKALNVHMQDGSTIKKSMSSGSKSNEFVKQVYFDFKELIPIHHVKSIELKGYTITTT